MSTDPYGIEFYEPDRDHIEELREARAEAWDEAVAAVFTWWTTPEENRPTGIVNPYGAGIRHEGEA